MSRVLEFNKKIVCSKNCVAQMAMPLTSHIISQMDLTSGFGNISFKLNKHSENAKNQTRLAYEDKRDLYCILNLVVFFFLRYYVFGYRMNLVIF